MYNVVHMYQLKEILMPNNLIQIIAKTIKYTSTTTTTITPPPSPLPPLSLPGHLAESQRPNGLNMVDAEFQSLTLSPAINKV